MHGSVSTALLLSAILVSWFGSGAVPSRIPVNGVVVRVATYNIEDVRTEDLRRPDHPRLREIARNIREIEPDIILLNEIAYDWPSDTTVSGGTNGQRFADLYLNDCASGSVSYRAVMPPPNTGLASGFDLDRSGEIVTSIPAVPEPGPDGRSAPQTPEGRAYGGDAWGFGMFPGQYGMALLVSEQFEILDRRIRSFQHFRWSSLPSPLRPLVPSTGESWYSEDAWERFPLSSKTHIDVPVKVAPETVLHILASHPTPPAFDGPERRNKLRNRDEIRFWSLYLDDSPTIVDDRGRQGGLAPDAHFVIVGDLNADPDEGSSFGDPIGDFLMSHPRVNGSYVPKADTEVGDLDSDDTAGWGLRVDYVLPSRSLEVVDGGVRRSRAGEDRPSDHFPVWIDVEVPTASQ